MSIPFFSVVVPAYNRGKLLLPTLQSVVEQTFQDWELIVIDDGSNSEEAAHMEATVQRARALLRENGGLDEAAAEQKIRFFRQKNQGVSAARNYGTTQAGAAWIAFLDSDDLWKPAMLESARLLLTEKPDTVLCHTKFDVIDENGDYRSAGHARRVTYLSYLGGGESPGVPSNSIFSKKIVEQLGGFDPMYPLGQDFDTFLKVYARYEAHIEFIPEVLASYRVHANNASKSYSYNQNENTNIITKHLRLGQYLQKPEIVRAARRGIKGINAPYGVAAYECARAEVRKRRPRAALSHLAYAVRRNPSFVLRQLARYFKRQ